MNCKHKSNKSQNLWNYTILSLFISLISCTHKDTSKLVVLTFDDAVKSHHSFVAPLLKEYDFGATFFITQHWMKDSINFLNWKEVADIHKMGFEIGNHTWSHMSFRKKDNNEKLISELTKIEEKLTEYNIPKPTSFAWPGNGFNPEAVALLRESGYKYARRGMQPEVDYGKLEVGPLYNPEKHNSLLIPTTGDAYPKWTLEYFKLVVKKSEEGKAIILQFHGVPDLSHPWVHTDPEKFKEFMLYLKENDFNVISLSELSDYLRVDEIDDPLLHNKQQRRTP